jgi:hypothetical protein
LDNPRFSIEALAGFLFRLEHPVEMSTAASSRVVFRMALVMTVSYFS